MGALEDLVVGGEDDRVFHREQALAFLFVEIEELPEHLDVGKLEVVFRELILVLKADLGVFDAGSPFDVVNAFDVLEEGNQALESIGELGGDEVEIEAAALLEVGELGDFEAVEHDLPADAPGAEGRGFPVVLFELDVVLGEVDADGFEAAEVLIDDVGGRGLEDDLELLVLIEAIGVFAVAAVGGAAAGLNISDTIWFRAKNAQKCFGGHGAGADFEVVGFGDNAAAVGPVFFEGEDGVLEGGGLGHRAARGSDRG